MKRGPYQLEDGEVVDLEMEEFDAEDDRGEYAPVVVEMDDDGREKNPEGKGERKYYRHKRMFKNVLARFQPPTSCERN